MSGILDPFSTNSSTLVFQKDLICDIRRCNDPDTRVLQEYINFRIIQDLTCQTIIITSEKDLFFSYILVIDQQKFIDIKTKQNILVGFQDLASFLTRLFQQASKDQSIQIILFLDEEANCTLQFMENFKGYKFIEVLKLEIQVMPENLLRQDITYKYLLLRQNNLMLQKQINEIQK